VKTEYQAGQAGCLPFLFLKDGQKSQGQNGKKITLIAKLTWPMPVLLQCHRCPDIEKKDILQSNGSCGTAFANDMRNIFL